MELILWRHADAESGREDMKRELTDKGRKQAARIAKWLRKRISKEWLILSSPAVRTCQTADALEMKYATKLTLSTDATPNSVLREAHWPDGNQNVIIVGHQPTLGQIAARLLSGRHGDISVKKGAIWWFSTTEEDEMISGITLRTVINPDLVEAD